MGLSTQRKEVRDLWNTLVNLSTILDAVIDSLANLQLLVFLDVLNRFNCLMVAEKCRSLENQL